MLSRLIFADAHLHSNPVGGLGAGRIAEHFAKKGGWFLALVSLPPWHYGLDPSRDGFRAYERALEIVVHECKEARSRGLEVVCFFGFHPSEVDSLVSRGVSIDKVLELGRSVIELAAKACREGKIDGIGEVGRQHYKTVPERFAVSYSILVEALLKARDNDCLVHLHLENAGSVTVYTVDSIVDLVGLRHSSLFFHHATTNVCREACSRGYWATIPGKLELMRSIFVKKLDRCFMIESDYIDDKKRECVSSCPWDIIDRQTILLREGIVTEEELYRINVDNVEKAYGVRPP